MIRFHEFLKHDEGATVVEMAVLTPFLFILALGIFEFGNVLYNHHLISTGIRDAGRYLARYPGPDPDDLCAGTPVASEAAAKQIAVTGSPGGGNKRVSWWDVGDITVNYNAINNNSVGGVRPYSDCDPVYVIRVSTNVSYNGLGFLNLIGIVGPTIDIALSHEERYLRR